MIAQPRPTETEPDSDPASTVLKHLHLEAEIFQHARYCAQWSVDTSGGHMVPFHLVQRGECWLHLAGQMPESLQPGDLVALPHDSEHAISSSASPPARDSINTARQVPLERADNVMLCGFFKFASRGAGSLLNALPHAIVAKPSTQAFVHLGNAAFEELSAPGAGSAALLETIARGLFIYILRAAIDKGLATGVLSALVDDRLGPALALIHKDPAANLSIEQLAAAANLGRTAFVDRFRAKVGQPPIRYLQQWRLQVALDLLTSSSSSVASIAAQVGYASEVSFRQSFKKEMGMTPSQARRHVSDGTTAYPGLPT